MSDLLNSTRLGAPKSLRLGSETHLDRALNSFTDITIDQEKIRVPFNSRFNSAQFDRKLGNIQ